MALLDKVVKGAAAGPIGVAGAALWVVGNGVYGIGRITGYEKLTDAGEKFTETGSDAICQSTVLVADVVGLSDNQQRDNALAAFTTLDSEGGGYLEHENLIEFAKDHPELSLGLEGIIGNEEEIFSKVADHLLRGYSNGRDQLDWDRFHKMWIDVVADDTGSINFYHELILANFDTELKGSLTSAQLHTLLDKMYFSENSPFAGDNRVPDRPAFIAKIEQNRNEEGNIPYTVMKKVFVGA
eukprot:TRINITY_DN658_c0_g1_i1.p1 TRINITY_DN658_c0_g1~~TRINITY_DN658_c0_g1_i1.p1  ORF type:complete len:240 (+),score=38.50 TRINITY_DN658_c0_g1_i1:55-774(+)